MCEYGARLVSLSHGFRESRKHWINASYSLEYFIEWQWLSSPPNPFTSNPTRINNRQRHVMWCRVAESALYKFPFYLILSTIPSSCQTEKKTVTNRLPHFMDEMILVKHIYIFIRANCGADNVRAPHRKRHSFIQQTRQTNPFIITIIVYCYCKSLLLSLLQCCCTVGPRKIHL